MEPGTGLELTMLETFSRLLPAPDETLFLRACVGAPAGVGTPAAPNPAWVEWRAKHTLRDTLERDGVGAKRLLPLLAYTLQTGGAPLDPTDVPYLQAARMREQLRAQRYRAILQEALAGLTRRGVDYRVLKGATLSQTVYPEPDLRHNHDIDLLVREAQLSDAAQALQERGFEVLAAPPYPNPEPTRLSFALKHRSGLPLKLHTRLFQNGVYKLTAEESWQRSSAVSFGDFAALTVAPELMLAHVLGHALYAVSRRYRVWVCDAYFLIRRTRALDWKQVTDIARRARMALPLYLLLDYMQRAFAVGVPQEQIQMLKRAAKETTTVEHAAVLALLRQNGYGGYRHWLKQAANGRERVTVAAWVVRSRVL